MQALPWIEPLELARRIEEPYWVLLYSSAKTSYSGRYSLLATGLKDKIEGSDFSALAARLSEDQSRFTNAWFGYLGYGLKDSLETLPKDQPSWPELPHLCMMNFSTVWKFDHDTQKLQVHSQQKAAMPAPPPAKDPLSPPRVQDISSNMTRAEYLAKAVTVIEHIREGDLYQANLTRKFGGHFEKTPDALALFETLCKVSPAPYSAYLRLNDTHILSSSPELFLRIDDEGNVETRPIKGTSARIGDKRADEQSKQALAASAKDKSENLMIVDLMRNDLSRSCEPGSITTGDMFAITSHATIHHMSSAITGKKRANVSTLDVIKGCFPPGSMTGAPKIMAMKLCTALEKLARGIYSGAIGYLGGDGSAELSVVIRTLIMRENRFEFQVGGGIVADSTPEQELKELIDKSEGIRQALGLQRSDLEAL